MMHLLTIETSPLFDGHKIDLRLTLKVIDPYGLESVVELLRIWILSRLSKNYFESTHILYLKVLHTLANATDQIFGLSNPKTTRS